MKKRLFVLLITTAAILVLAPICSAVTVNLFATADSNVKNVEPETSFPDGDLSPYKTGDLGKVGEIAKAYIQFQLPDDVVSVSDAKFTIAQTSLTGVLSYYVMGVKDSVLQGNPNDYTWINAPGNTPDYNIIVDKNQDMYDIDSADYLGYLTTSSYVPIGTEFTLDETAIDTLINDDNDGVVTIFMSQRQAIVAQKTLASIENMDWPGPQLEITYTPAIVIVSQSDHLTAVAEGGSADTYEVSLAQAPTAAVTVDIDYDSAQLTLDKSSLVFPAGSTTAQTVTVNAVDDAYGEAPLASLITHVVSSDDANFDGVELRNVVVHVTDDDTASAVLTASADSSVKRSDPTASFPTGDLSPQKVNGPPIELVTSYVQFDLPSDFQYALGATFTLTQTSGLDDNYVADPNNPLTEEYAITYIVGVEDDVVQPSPDSYTWLNAPGNDIRFLPIDGLTGFNTEQARYLSQVTVSNLGPQGSQYQTIALDSDEIAEWLSQDSDKKVTIMLLKESEGVNDEVFASVENATFEAVTMDLVYGNVAYCGQPAQVYSDYDFNNDCNVDMIDLAEVAARWLACTDPASPACN